MSENGTEEKKVDSSDLRLIQEANDQIQNMMRTIGSIETQKYSLLNQVAPISNRLEDIVRIALNRAGIPAEEHSQCKIDPESGSILEAVKPKQLQSSNDDEEPPSE